MSSGKIDTIVALATPPGRSGIGIVRMSGPKSLHILRQLIASPSFDPQPNALTLRTLVDPANHDPLDESMVCYFRAPRSFTGEDVVEIHSHGSPILLRSIMDAALGLGARMAEAGEFSLRAVANGRMSLTEAEAIRDLIDAQTEAAVKQASRQLQGEISNIIEPLHDELLRVIVRLESSLEFVEDDLPLLERAVIAETLRGVRYHCDQLADTFSRGRLIRDGIRVTLIGRPNVGKSSIFNRLVGHARAIVTTVPGTTRDTITESIGMNGVPIVLTDTAGLRPTQDEIESIGVELTKRAAADSDLLVIVIDGSEGITEQDRRLIDEAEASRYVIALNKSDLPSFSSNCVTSYIDTSQLITTVNVSAVTNNGIEALRTAIIDPFTNGNSNATGLLITNARHHDLLRRASDAVRESEELVAGDASEEIVLLGLRNALTYLGEITGQTTSDEILGEIFSSFCIGK